ncbi:MAG: HAMP domain-containing protein [Desulfobacteraceae bacterium]|nr:HAMP domain-containing protein [Desulfobacteraceae bacterium]MBC2750687.1 zinc-ribbon domain-containing protein [Desulfobacteraceae bacterium]
MIVICEECGKKYKIDPGKIKGEQARFKCKACSHIITVNKVENRREPEPTVEPETMDSAVADSTEVPEETIDKSEPPSQVVEPSAPPVADRIDRRKKKAGMGLTTKVILLMLLVSLLPGTIYFILSFKQANDRIVSDTTQMGMQTAGVLADEVDEWLDKNIRVLNTVAQMPGIQSMNRFEQEILLQTVQKEYPWMYLVFTTDINGMNVARNDGKELKDYSDRQYVQDITSGKDLTWQNLIGKTSKQPALVIAVPIRKNNQTIGVMAAAMTRDAISQRIANWRQGKTGYAFLVDQYGKVVSHQLKEFVEEQKDLSNHPLVKAANANKNSMIEFKNDNGRDEIGFSKTTQLGWALAIQQEKNEAFAILKESQMFAFALMGATFIVVLIIAYIASRAIVTPIRKLTDAANRISVGELGVEIENKSKDEIGDLAEAITRMQDSIRLSIERLRRRRR